MVTLTSDVCVKVVDEVDGLEAVTLVELAVHQPESDWEGCAPAPKMTLLAGI